MWFVVYRIRPIFIRPDGSVLYGNWSTVNTVCDTHPVLKILGWRARHTDSQYLLLFYSEVPEDMRNDPSVRYLDFGCPD